ncbi:MAG TPA: 4-(cytidine 5'-diphospho)-2-C-methyl-D-erythritol kinase [Bryobacteraceae bacterium]|nr:4-(cytidine 5'-diphospho)-2-C-methyl-D-erythritol kinase [Bryobacteraceae bacterium]
MTRKARLRAFAKLNLGLRVLYKRPDGYHELRTVFQTISLADRLDVAFTPASETRIVIEGTPEIPDNLVEKAARLALEAMSIHADVRFKLKKNIPSGAGLGGGSSDAAAVLLALPVLAGIPIEYERLFSIAARLGSDVPFFLHGGTALGLGRGEELYPLPSPPKTHALLVAPAIHSSTAEAYRDLSATLTSIALQNKLVTFQRQLWAGLTGIPENDFEAVVFARHPELSEIRDRLLSLGARHAMMTGSGSAIFGVFAGRATLEAARGSFPGERVFPISFVSRSEYRSQWQRALKQHLAPSHETSSNREPWPPRSLYAR